MGFPGGRARRKAAPPAIVLNKVEGATISNSTAQQGTRVFLGVTGTNTRDILLEGNELHNAQLPYQLFGGTKEGIVRSEEHTSELQSQSNLACRLLLETKNDGPTPS